MVQYFNSFEEEQDDPVLFELDVYLNNSTLADMLGCLENLPDKLSILKELSTKPFERLLFLQYPLELCNYLEDSTDDGSPRKLVNSNTSDRLTLKSLEIGECVQTNEVNSRRHYTSNNNRIDRHTSSPLVRLNFDLGVPYLSKYKSSPFKKSKGLTKYESDVQLSPPLGPTQIDRSRGTVLTFDSTVSTSEHVSDCLGLLKIEESEDGFLKRELHLLPVKSILQMRPKLDYFNEITDEENCTDLFFNRNLNWQQIDNVYFPESKESKELIEHFLKYGKETRGIENTKIHFNPDRVLYVNSLCVPANGTLSTYQSFSSMETISNEFNLNQVYYTRVNDTTPNIRFMKRLSVEMQLKLLLSNRVIDSFYSLKSDIMYNDIDDNGLIDILSGFAKCIDGNWVIASEYSIENYTEEDDCTPEERLYLVSCRNLMLGLLNRQSSHHSLQKSKTSTSHMATERFINATGLPLKIMNDMIWKIARPQGKFWTLKLDRDELFCRNHPQVFNTFQKYWAEQIPKAANIIQSFKSNSRVNQIAFNVIIKGAIVNFIKDGIYTHDRIINHLKTLGYTDEDVDSILSQVAMCLSRKFWVLKKTQNFVEMIKSMTDIKLGYGGYGSKGDSGTNSHGVYGTTGIPRGSKDHIPEFILRRVYRYRC